MDSPSGNFGQLLQTARKVCSLSQEKLADVTGLHRTFISDLERGVRNPTLATISTLAKGLNITPSDLLQGYSDV
jgi:transcriptional regulator with XRE-family HTH domain